MNRRSGSQTARRLVRYGILLFLFGLLTGLAIPFLQNPRMGLSSHLEGTLNGMLLVLFGLIWPQLRLSQRLQTWAYGLALFGTYTNWGTTLLAALWGAGGTMMPIAGGAFSGLAWQEVLVQTGLVTLTLAMLVVCAILLWGLRGEAVVEA